MDKNKFCENILLKLLPFRFSYFAVNITLLLKSIGICLECCLETNFSACFLNKEGATFEGLEV